MKHINLAVLIAIIIIAITACKKNDAVQMTVDEKPVPTPVGTLIGTATTKIIGNSGGTVASADGRIELIVPAGAVSADTLFSIQAITNNAPNGISNAYRFMPGGMKFTKPVTLKIHYSAEDASHTLPGLMGIAVQDSTGIWWRVNNFTDDTVSGIISAPILHFSDWTLFNVMNITPSAAAVKVDESVNLQVTYVNGKDGDDSSYLSPLTRKVEKITWYVNSIANGNATVGTLTATSDDDKLRVYKAPVKVPPQNPVAVTAQVKIIFEYNGKTFNDATLISNINIGGDSYLLEIVEKRDPLQLGLWLTDSASMDVNIAGNGVVVNNIKNFEPVSSPSSVTASGCTFSYTEDKIGDINIIAASGELRIQSSSKKGIQFLFTHSGTHDPGMRQYCPQPAPLPPYDITSTGAAHKGKPLTLFFDLLDSVAYYEFPPLPGNSLTATLTIKK